MKDFVQVIYTSVIGLSVICIGLSIWVVVGFGAYWVLKHFNEPLAYVGAVASIALPHFIYSRIRVRRGCGLSTAFAELTKRVLLISPTMLIMFGWEYCVVTFEGLMEEGGNDGQKNVI